MQPKHRDLGIRRVPDENRCCGVTDESRCFGCALGRESHRDGPSAEPWDRIDSIFQFHVMHTSSVLLSTKYCARTSMNIEGLGFRV